MMSDNRLAQLEKNLTLLYEQLGAMEQGELLTPDPGAKIKIRQQIREEIKPKIKGYETEYFQVLHQLAPG